MYEFYENSGPKFHKQRNVPQVDDFIKENVAPFFAFRPSHKLEIQISYTNTRIPKPNQKIKNSLSLQSIDISFR